jgi:hypothetical protein
MQRQVNKNNPYVGRSVTDPEDPSPTFQIVQNLTIVVNWVEYTAI